LLNYYDLKCLIADFLMSDLIYKSKLLLNIFD